MLKKIFLILVLSFSSVFAKTLYLDEVPVGQADPAKYSDKADKIIVFNTYDTLVTEKEGSNGEMIGSLASSWKVSGINYIFELKKNVLFHSGNELTSEDVVYSYQRFMKINQGFAYLFSGWVKNVKSLGKYKVQFTLEKAYAPFLSSLIHLAIVDKKTVLAKGKSDNGQKYLSKNSAGTGAYKIESHNPQKSTVFIQNKKYFQFIDKKAPTKVILKYGLKEATVRSLMTRGKHSLSSTWLPPEVFRSLSKNRNIKLLTNSGSSLFFIKLNTQKPPLDDKNCRKALAYALDYKSLMNLNKITNSVLAAKSSNGPIPQGMLGYKNLKPYKQDMTKAKSFLKKCKYKPSNFELEISWIAEVPLEERFALLMAKNYKSLGFKTKVVKVPWALFTQKVTKVKSTPHISQIFSPSATPDPDTLLYNTYHSSFQGTWMAAEWLNDKTTDRLLEQARTEKNQSKRRTLYEKLVEHLRELQPSIFAYEEVEVYAARKNIDIPAFSSLKNSFSTDTLGLSFRFMKVK